MNSFNGWVIFHGVYVPQLPYPFICWWASRLLPCPGCDKQCCSEHWGARVSFRSGFLGVYAQKWDCWVRNFEDKLCSRWRTLKEAVLGREMLKFSTLNKLHILLWQFLRHLVKFKIVYVVQRINLMGLWALFRLCFFLIYYVFTLPDLDYLYLIAMYYRWGLCHLAEVFFNYNLASYFLLQLFLPQLYPF